MGVSAAAAAIAWVLLSAVVAVSGAWRVSARRWAAALSGTALSLALVLPGPWHPNNHGISVYLTAMDDPAGLQAGLTSTHGFAWLDLLRFASPVAAPDGVQLVVAVLAALAVGAWVEDRADAVVGDWATLWWSTLPFVLRLSRTDTFMLLYVGLMAGMLAAAGAWWRGRDVGALGVAACLAVGVHAHTAMVVMAPAALPLDAAVRVASGERPRGSLRALALAGGLLGVFVVARVWPLLASDVDGEHVSNLAFRSSDVLLPACVGVAVAAAAFRGPRVEPRWTALLLGCLGVACVAGAWVALSFDDGEVFTGLGPLGVFVPVLDPNRAPPVAGAVVLVGAASVLARDRWGLLFLGWLWCGHLLVFATNVDGFLGAVRFCAPLGWFFAWPAGLGLSALARTVPAGGVIAGVVLLTATHAPWLGHAFPMQVEWALVRAARAELGPRGRVHTLLSDDLPDAASYFTANGAYRDHLRDLAYGPGGRGDPLVRGLTQRAERGALYLRPLACFRSPMRQDGDTWHLWVHGRPTSLVVDDMDPGAAIHTGPAWSLEALGACAVQPERWTCVDPGVMCGRWDPPSRCPDVAADYLDPACRAFEAAHTLEPIVELPLPRTDDNLELSVVHQPGAVVGLYRVVE